MEQDPGIRALLMEMIFDPEIDGSEDQKNRFLAPAEPVPLLDREVAQAMEQPIGMLEPERVEAPPVEPPEPMTRPLRPTATANSVKGGPPVAKTFRCGHGRRHVR